MALHMGLKSVYESRRLPGDPEERDKMGLENYEVCHGKQQIMEMSSMSNVQGTSFNNI